MDIKSELKRLIVDEVLVEIDDYLDEILEIIASKKEDASIKDELKNMQEMKKEFLELLDELENDELSNEECEDLLEEIKAMIDEDFLDE